MRVWKLNLEVGESLPRQDLAFPSRWISQENWCLLMSCQGSRGHCYHRKLSLSSQGMWDIRVRGRWCLQSRVLKPGCPGAWVGASWWHLPRTAEVQGPAQPCCHLSVPLGQGKRSQNCFYSWALPLSTAALGACRLCRALALDCCSSPKVPGRKSSKPKTPVGVFKGFWVGIMICSSLDGKGLAKTRLSQNPVSHPPLCTWVGCVWDGDGAPKRMTWSVLWRGMQSKQKTHCLLCTLTVLLSHMDFALITELPKFVFSLRFLFLRQNYLRDFLICFPFPLSFYCIRLRILNTLFLYIWHSSAIALGILMALVQQV